MKTPIRNILCSKAQFSWVNLIVFLLIIIFCSFSAISHYGKEITQFEQNEKVLNGKIEELTKKNDVLKASPTNIVWMQSLHQPKLSSQEIQHLKKKGLRNPINDLIADLMKHNELIPYQGVLGGKMGFHSSRDIYVLSTKLVRASFDDGHANGWMLLEYQIADGSKISWKVLESYLE